MSSVNNTDFSYNDTYGYINTHYWSDLELLSNLILVGCVILVGSVGNILVLTVYSRKYRRTATRYLISVIATCDLFSIVVLLPCYIYLHHQEWATYDVTTDVLCRATWVIASFSVEMSAFLLVVVAVVRYRKVCTPQNCQISVSHCKFLIGVVAAIIVVISIPHGVVHSQVKVPSSSTTWYEYDCGVEKKYTGQNTPLLVCFYGTLFFIKFVSSGTIVTLYYKMWKRIRSIKRIGKDKTERINNGKTTKMMFVISIFYILTFMPFYVIEVLKKLQISDVDSPFPYFYLLQNLIWLSSASNPIIYSVCDANFRLQCQPVFRPQKKKTITDYRNNIFIGYADDDVHFVRFVLRKFLEDDLHMTTYIQHRDGRGGFLDVQLLDAIQVPSLLANG